MLFALCLLACTSNDPMNAWHLAAPSDQQQVAAGSVSNLPGLPIDITPPDSITAAARRTLFVKANIVRDDSAYADRFLKDVISIVFKPGAGLKDRRNAIAAVGGILIGGVRIAGNGDGAYLITIPGDGTTKPMFRALAVLDSLPQVAAAGVEDLGIGPPSPESPLNARREVRSRSGGLPVMMTMTPGDTSRPAVPATFAYPADRLHLIQNPGDTQWIYLRRFAIVAFKKSVTGGAVREFFARRHATITGGLKALGDYEVEFPDPGASWSAYSAFVDSVNADPAVRYATPVAWRGAMPRVDGNVPGEGHALTPASRRDDPDTGAAHPLLQEPCARGAVGMPADTSRPVRPDASSYPADSLHLVQNPTDTAWVYLRRYAIIRFQDAASGPTIRRVLCRWGAVIVGGEPTIDAYMVELPDSGSGWLPFYARLQAIQNDPAVAFAVPMAWRSPKPPIFGVHPTDVDALGQNRRQAGGLPIEAIPPDSVMASFRAALYDSSNISRRDSVIEGSFPRNVVMIYFKATADAGHRRAAIESVGGILFGGLRTADNGDGEYLIQVPAGSSNRALLDIINRLNAMPQVAVAWVDAQDFGPISTNPSATFGSRRDSSTRTSSTPTEPARREQVRAESTATTPRAEATIPTGLPIEAIPPDSVLASFRANLYDSANLSRGDTVIVGTFPRDVVVVNFKASASVALRRAAIRSVGGTLFGGLRIDDNGDGPYLIQVPTGGSNRALLNIINRLNAMPQVDVAWVDAQDFGPITADDGVGTHLERHGRIAPKRPATGDKWTPDSVPAQSVDTGRPPVPHSLNYPLDSTHTVTNPQGTQWIYQRRFALIGFRGNASGLAIRAFLARHDGTIVGGSTFSGTYLIEVPDPGNSWEAFKASIRSMEADPAVEFVVPITWREAKPVIDGARPTDGTSDIRPCFTPGSSVRAHYSPPT